MLSHGCIFDRERYPAAVNKTMLVAITILLLSPTDSVLRHMPRRAKHATNQQR